jgi:hypothetical protein
VGNAFKREEGWRELGADVARAARAAPYDSISAQNRSVVAELLYYARPRSVPIRMWTRDSVARDHFAMTMRLKPPAARVLLAIEPIAAGRVLATFDSARRVERLAIAVGGHRARVIELYDAHDYRDPQPARAVTPVSPPRDL